MNGGRVGEVVLHVGGNAVAAEGVLRHVHPLGDSPRRCLADGGACVPKVLPAAELEGILAGLIVAVPLEPAGGAAVSNDVEEPQELPVEPPTILLVSLIRIDTPDRKLRIPVRSLHNDFAPFNHNIFS